MFYVLRSKLLRLVSAGALLMLFAGFPGGALGAELHAFNPVLSLTGDCSVSTLDPVPDPGCPGGANPASPFSNPKAVTTDFYGNIYVSSPTITEHGAESKIDIFDSLGNFITEVADESGPGALAVDSEGNLYVANLFGTTEETLVRYAPTLPYEPASGEIEYADSPSVIVKQEASGNGIAINPADDHLFRKRGFQIIEYSSAKEGNNVVETFGEGQLQEEPIGIAVDAAHGRIYAPRSLGTPGNLTKAVRVFDLAAPHNLLPCTVEEADVPGGKLQSPFLSVAADEGTGHFFLYDGEGAQKVYEFDQNCEYVSTIEHGFKYTFLSQIGVDNGKFSPHGALNGPEGHYLFVPSNTSAPSHAFAFGPSNVCDPAVESTSFSNVGEAEAELGASIEPCGLETHYSFEYLTRQQYEDAGNSFAGAQLAGAGEIPTGSTPIDVAAAAEGLAPGTRYRYRVVAENEEGKDEEEGEFATFPAAEPSPSCSNDALRGGFSALLPDCRAYELVTPPDTNARAPLGLTHLGNFFATRKASPGGGAVSFVIEGGLIPGSEGTGSLFGDPYLATRGEDGWSTVAAGPSAIESGALLPGSNSPDQGYSFWETGGPRGTAVIGGKPTAYVRYPDGHSALVGRGSLGSDPRALGKLISEGGTHIVFGSGEGSGGSIQLEPNAPPNGTGTLYDRTADEVTHVVSLLPGDKTPKAGEGATYEGASMDGRGVAFKIGTTLYLRHDNEKTFEIGNGVTFAGIAEGGVRIFYLEGGTLFRFDALTEEVKAFNPSGTVIPVNVSADGSTAYFTSTAILTTEPNPTGAKAATGKENLYRSQEGTISFVGTVTEEDVKGKSNGNENLEGLGLWTEVVGSGRLVADPSRTAPDGNVLLFESRAPLTGYDPGGHAEIYRYDFSANSLTCLSCNPTLAPATSAASLQSISRQPFEPEPLTSYGLAGNLSADGNRAFFQSTEALVPADVDGLQDVYEWETQGVGSCGRPGGCTYLISSGHSARIDYLYGSGDTGDDVFFTTPDVLLGRDAEETPSIYDARVGGGFAETAEEECVGEGCRPGVTPAADLPTPGMLPSKASGNLPKPACPKGKHKAKRHGKTVCVKKKHHKKHKHQKQAGKSKGAGK